MSKKICIVTGATSGIGLEAAKALVVQGFFVILACRNAAKADKVRTDIIDEINCQDIVAIPLELSSFASIDAFVKSFKKKYSRLDVLVNNAGTFCDRQHQTEEGFELTMGVNYIGAYYLTQRLLSIIKKTPQSRIIHVSSIVGLHYRVKKDAWDFHNIRHGFRAYNASKLAQILYTIDMAEQLDGEDVTVNVLHPGVIATNIWTGEGIFMKLTKPFMKLLFPSAKKGAETIIYLASSEAVEGVSGKLFAKCKQVPYRNALLDKTLRNELMGLTRKAVLVASKHEEDIAI
ncbi:MAG: SDR family oxidoreductase [Clostridiales bacterium]|nr:SDR family oxidoreductase [Clostridiales bacterium]